ncbi:DUF4292 domain-containing protein [Pedobacter alpinus]
MFLFACKAKKKAVETVGAINDTEMSTKKSANFNKIKTQQANFETFTTKAATALSIKGKSYDVTLNMRIKKGKGIWVSVTYFAGLEVARALITPDSVKVMDKINNQYIKKSFSFIQSYTNEQIDYQTLEAILVGNCIPFTLADKKNFITENGQDIIKGKNQQLNYKVSFNTDFKPSVTELFTVDNAKKLNINIISFENVLNVLLPKNINISSVSGAQAVKLNMEYTKTQLNEPVDFPFNVSKRFSVID